MYNTAYFHVIYANNSTICVIAGIFGFAQACILKTGIIHVIDCHWSDHDFIYSSIPKTKDPKPDSMLGPWAIFL